METENKLEGLPRIVLLAYTTGIVMNYFFPLENIQKLLLIICSIWLINIVIYLIFNKNGKKK